MNTEGESYEDQRVRAWYNKQQLDCLPTFSSRLKYWIDFIDPFPSAIHYLDGENAPFALSIEPETDDDRRELHKCWFNFYRKNFIEEKRPVDKFAWIYNAVDKHKQAFLVRSFDVLKEDLEKRLIATIREKNLLEKELEKIIVDINSAGRIVNGVSPALAEEISELRYVLETNRQYDFLFINDYDAPVKAVRLAQVWDIVHYEAYLKDRLAGLSALTELSNVTSRTDRYNVTPSPAILASAVNEEPSPEDVIKQQLYTAQLILARFTGKNQSKQPIMSQANYARLTEYVTHLVVNERLPHDIQPLAKINISNEHIRFTFYLIHRELYGTRAIRQNFIDFLHSVFSQFAGTSPKTTRAKFNTPPKSYDKDFTGYIGEVS